MKKYLAEMVGTMVLVLMGCGVAVSLGCDPVNNIPAVVGTALAFGLAVVAMAYTIGGVSGCHINPAITLGCLVTGRISAKDCAGYLIGQVAGAIIAGAALAGIYGAETGIGANGIGAGCNGSAVTALIVEAILTALFVLVVLGATHKTNGDTGKFAGLAIGLSLILIHLVGIHFTGTSVNPARSIGPALFAGGEALANVWIFIVGPFVGAIIAAGLWKLVEPKEA